MATWLGYALVTLSGALLATQPSTTAALAKQTKFPSFSALMSFVTGIVIVLVYFLIETKGGHEVNVKGTTWWAWTGGVVGALYIICISLYTQRLSATVLIAILISAQLVISALIDHFGWLEMPKREMNIGKGIGVAFILVGTLLVTIFTKGQVDIAVESSHEV